MDRIKRWIEKVNARRLENQYDALVPVIGDEGVGKSTLMLQLAILHRRHRDRNDDPEAVLDRIVWQDRNEFQNALGDSQRYSVVMTHDAARVLHKKETMVGDQVEIEKDLLDVRTKNLLILLGFQDWDVMPDLLQSRRANFLLRIPERGRVEGYSRASIDQKYEDGGWPTPDMVDSFPSLEGTDYWDRFTETDTEKKNERISGEEDLDEQDVVWREHCRVALRGCRPWEARGEPLTQKDVAELIDRSDSWVSDRVQEFKRGYYREMVADLPGAPGADGTQGAAD